MVRENVNTGQGYVVEGRSALHISGLCFSHNTTASSCCFRVGQTGQGSSRHIDSRNGLPNAGTVLALEIVIARTQVRPSGGKEEDF